MSGRIAERERVLALLWLAGSLLTALTVVLPYDADVDETARAGIAALALVTGLALLFSPPLPDAVLHAVVALGTLAVGVCTSLGVADVEGVMMLLPILFAFAAFRAAPALAHLALAAAVYGVVLATAGEDTVAPWISFTLVLGVATVMGVAIALLVDSRERAVTAGRRDRRIAEALQRTLLPETLPATPGIALAARYVPADEEADVGGDLYDVIELGGERLALAIGDVAGKGLPAATMVGRTRSALRAYALADPAPDSVVPRLNRLLSSEPGATRMTTLLYAVLDPAAESLTWSSAGHPPPLLVPATGPPRYLKPGAGVPLGVLPHARFAVQQVPFGPGDRLLLFTDGLVERHDGEIDDALARLADVAARCPEPGPDDLLQAALHTAPRPQRDDVAVLAVGLVALGDRLAVELPSRPEALAGLRAVLQRWLAGRLSPAATDGLLLACSEMAANAILHAGSAGNVRVEAVIEADRVRVQIHDRGRWRLPTGDDHGYGLQLARALVEHLDVQTGRGGTTVTLEQGLGAQPAAARPLGGDVAETLPR